MASVNVGWAWLMRAMSSAEALYSMATTASAIMSAARGPQMCTPKNFIGFLIGQHLDHPVGVHGGSGTARRLERKAA